jgi:hypothetical protein
MPPPAYVEASSEGSVLRVRVTPRAPRDAVQGPLGDELKIRLQAPPVEGKANTALQRFLARRLGLPAAAVVLLSGATARSKRVLLRGIDPAAADRAPTRPSSAATP